MHHGFSKKTLSNAVGEVKFFTEDSSAIPEKTPRRWSYIIFHRGGPKCSPRSITWWNFLLFRNILILGVFNEFLPRISKMFIEEYPLVVLSVSSKHF